MCEVSPFLRACHAYGSGVGYQIRVCELLAVYPPSALLILYSAFYRFSISCVNVPEAAKTVTDALYRDNFYVVHPHASLECAPVAKLELLVTTRPNWWSPAWTNLFTRLLAGALQTSR